MNVEKSLVEAGYYLPFDTSRYPVRISQGNNGPWSHFLQKIPRARGKVSEVDLTYAVDFALPLGSEVLAARGGTIVHANYSSEWCYEGLDPDIGNHPPQLSTNFVVIEHQDGTWGWYSHLSAERVATISQVIRRGDLIGYTGKSGWIARIPHLHMQVNNAVGVQRTLQVNFQNYDGSLDHQSLLNQGKIWFGE